VKLSLRCHSIAGSRSPLFLFARLIPAFFRPPLPVLRERVGVRVIRNSSAVGTRNHPHPRPLPEYREREKANRLNPALSARRRIGSNRRHFPVLKRFAWLTASILLVFSLPILADPPATNPSAYFNDFEHAAKGKPGDEFTILNGDFSIREEAGNSFLELPGDPLDTFGLLFGPGDSAALDVCARIWADSTGKRFPEFGIGSNDTGGYKLWLWPAQGTIELRKADDAKASKPFAWKPAAWLRLRLRVRQLNPRLWHIEGKAWPDGAPEPADWLLNFDDTEEPTAGKASIWGVPFSGKPIRFDDLSAKPAE